MYDENANSQKMYYCLYVYLCTESIHITKRSCKRENKAAQYN